MRCHYCEREAAYEAEQSGVVVGLCEEHFKARVEELAESDELCLAPRQDRYRIVGVAIGCGFCCLRLLAVRR